MRKENKGFSHEEKKSPNPMLQHGERMRENKGFTHEEKKSPNPMLQHGE
jgi:hypothetical protein